MLKKREFIWAVSSILGALVLSGVSLAGASGVPQKQLETVLQRIEKESGGRLGVAVLDTNAGIRAFLHGDDRFPITSTFKFLASAAVLKQVAEGRSSLDKLIKYTAADVVPNSPETEKHIEIGMALADICKAAITLSDNTAGNMLLREIGGPAGLTSFARSLGDDQTRLDRWEVELNEALPGDPRDTTTPVSMLKNLQLLLFGDALPERYRQTLMNWLFANKTGDARLRAGLPHDWKVADKTGSGERGSTNDIGVLWPPGRKPILVAVYSTGSSATAEQRNATIAKVARAIAEMTKIE